MFCCYPLVLSLLVLIRISEGHLYAKGPTSSRSGFSPFSTWTWVYSCTHLDLLRYQNFNHKDGVGWMRATSGCFKKYFRVGWKRCQEICTHLLWISNGEKIEPKKKMLSQIVCLHLKRSSLLDGGWNWRFLPDFISRSGWNNCHLLLQNISK